MWLDEKFSFCGISTKLLFCYLITNPFLSLSPYLHISDRQILFDTGLNLNQLKTGKEELTHLKWMFFAEGWIFHNHKCAYIDYEGRDRVLQSKEEEILKVPQEIKDLFKGLITGYEPVLNHKSKTINQKQEDESVREGETTALEAIELITRFNLKMKKNYQLTEARKTHIRARLKTFSAEQLETAVDNLAASPWHRGENDRKWSADPDFLFRSDEQVDKFLNFGSDQSSKKEKIFITHLIEEASHATSF
jgi:uncharacterized phage protein (TIGR02220 family)